MKKKLIFLVFILLASIFFSLGFSGYESEFGYKALYEFLFLDISKDKYDMYYQIFVLYKAPRIVLAVLVGALLASSGAVVQSVFLNPLADPYIIGIASAATFGAVLAYILNLSEFFYGIFAFVFSVILSLVILFVYKKHQNIATLLILGIAISSFLSSFTSLFIYLIGQDSFKITAWLMGYLGSATWFKVLLVLLPTCFCIGFFYYKRYELDILLCGDEEAHSLGVNVFFSKVVFLLICSVAVAYSVAFCGMIGFVGLIIPHILRVFTRSSSNVILIPYASLVGAVFLLLCDDLARGLMYPVEIPIGVITAFFGAPFFIFLALRKTHA